MLRNLSDPAYTPLTCLMDEVCPGAKYEIVISVLHGGAFMRYRIGDVYRCTEVDKATGVPLALPMLTAYPRS